MHLDLNTMKLSALLAVLLMSHSAVASVTTTLTPGDINGLDTNTTMFDDGTLQLTPLIGSTAATFNGNGTRLGIDNNGTNNNAFNDPDVDPSNANDERLAFAFTSAAGLSQISWDFSRADGPGGGVFISGFAADPMASFSGVAAGYTSTFDAMTGTLTFEIPGADFAAGQGFLDLGDISASAGQSLLLRVADVDQAGSQLAIRSISYTTVKVPEPTAAGILIGLSAVVCGRRRRK